MQTVQVSKLYALAAVSTDSEQVLVLTGHLCGKGPGPLRHEWFRLHLVSCFGLKLDVHQGPTGVLDRVHS